MEEKSLSQGNTAEAAVAFGAFVASFASAIALLILLLAVFSAALGSFF